MSTLPARNRQVRLRAHPEGPASDGDFELIEGSVPAPDEGQMLCRTLYLSLDPYMRGRMGKGPSYARGVEIGEVMVGQTVSEVVESDVAGYEAGDVVLNASGWQEYGVSDGRGVRKLDPAAAPITTALGVLGMPGLTAYVGLLHIAAVKAGETVVVSAASGAVGSVAGQIARLKGCRVVGIAGAQEKCDYVTGELGFDACVSHRSEGMAWELASVCPNGVDVYFDNVGGRVFEAVLPLLNPFGRVPVCGRISVFGDRVGDRPPAQLHEILALILVRRLTLRGFIVFDHAEHEPAFLRDVAGWVRAGQIRYREHVVDGLENAVSAFQGLFRGDNFGKLLVRVSGGD